MLSSNTILQNRYRIVRELGRGGMGAVYEAIDQRLTSKVALKQMLGAGDIQARSAFEREAALLANLNHPNLPRVTDHFSENEGAYLVMQFIEGMDLAEWLDLRGSPFPQSQVLQWADVLLEVLEYLHGHNPPILHRDIKPANIKRTEDGRIYLLDFGLAKGSLGQMPTYEGSRSIRGGTPSYAPLEQFYGPGTDSRSDLYSLGATLYHLISGVLPADAGSRYQTMEDEEPDPLRSLTGFASPKVASVIERAISIGRKQRPGSASEMRRALWSAAEEDERHRIKEEYHRAEEQRRARAEKRHEARDPATNPEHLPKSPENKTGGLDNAHLETEKKRPEKADHVRDPGTDFHDRVDTESEQISERAVETDRRDHEHSSADPAAGIEPDPARLVVPSPTIPAKEPVRAREPSVVAYAATMPAPPPPSPPITRVDEVPATNQARKKTLFIATSILMVLVLTGIAIWLVSRRSGASSQIPRNSEVKPSESASSPQLARETAPPPTHGVILPGAPGIDMVYLPASSFTMGSTNGDADEKPTHSVTFKNGFFMSKFEVTQGQWKSVMGITPRQQRDKAKPSWAMRGEGDNFPIYYVSWNEANEFVGKLNKLNDGYTYSLPTEAQWEYACRAGTTGDYAGVLEDLAWFGNNSGDKQLDAAQLWRGGSNNYEKRFDANHNQPHQVGTKQPNAFGLYDMHGNVEEWCQDVYHKNYEKAPVDGSVWLGGGDTNRILRGGSWYTEGKLTRCSYRVSDSPTYRDDIVGFRLVAMPRSQ